MMSRTAVYGVGGTFLVACLAAANMPQDRDTPPAREPRAAQARTPDAIALDVQSQAARLQTLMARAPAPDPSLRNPFAFDAAPRPLRAAASVAQAPVADEPAAPLPPPLPALILLGVAEDSTPGGPRRTAIIGGDGDTIYMVSDGEAVGERYRVKKIGADAVELEDVVTKAYRRLAMR
jgi:Tfp pilus assembly protein PilP